MRIPKYFFHIIALVTVLALAASCKKDNNGTTTYTTDKTALNKILDSLTTVYNTTKDGTKPGNYAVGARAALDSAILLAKQVSGSTAYTQQEVTNTLNNLIRAGQQFSTQLLQEVSVANLVAFWKFNGNALDSSGNGNNGMLKTGWIGTSAATAVDGGTLPTLVADRFGRPNMAYDFNNGATVEVPYNAALNPQSLTICLWVKRHGTNSNNYMVSLNRWNGYKFQLQSGNLSFLTINTSTGDHDQDGGSKSVVDSADVWRHLAVSYTPGTMKFYVQGKLVQTANVTGTPLKVSSAINLAIGNELPKSAYNITNSSDPNYFYGGDFFIGSLDEVRFYSTALSDAEILSIFTNENSL